ncbi:hypothetical protein BH23BAC1_BH23BAC1_04900 [soil metagenome]
MSIANLNYNKVTLLLEENLIIFIALRADNFKNITKKFRLTAIY